MRNLLPEKTSSPERPHCARATSWLQYLCDLWPCMIRKNWVQWGLDKWASTYLEVQCNLDGLKVARRHNQTHSASYIEFHIDGTQDSAKMVSRQLSPDCTSIDSFSALQSGTVTWITHPNILNNWINNYSVGHTACTLESLFDGPNAWKPVQFATQYCSLEEFIQLGRYTVYI